MHANAVTNIMRDIRSVPACEVKEQHHMMLATWNEINGGLYLRGTEYVAQQDLLG
jgi:hypothetical protein